MSVSTRFAAACAATALAAGLGLTAAGTAAATPASTSMSASKTQVKSWSCGFYSGTVETVYGNNNDRVREVQCLLVYVWGWNLGSTGPDGDGVDGDFGGKTLAAVKGFQTWDNNRGCSIRLTVDGRVGTHTWSALRSDNGCPTV
ncbi:peptidoglycan-binding domain-containing protein [Streptomyces sp. NPDC054794]